MKKILISLFLFSLISCTAPKVTTVVKVIKETQTKDPWKKTISTVKPSIVYIHYYVPHALEMDKLGVFSGTGFVVDKENGIILSNRHIVGLSPTRAKATFTNYEEVDLVPIYIDPVHDFGFFKYDPKKLNYPKLKSLELNDENLKVGTQIRVIGNDGGQELSILDGTISRLDKNAPNYSYGYFDFNTFYLQSNAGTSGGSSGSPVIDVKGKVLGLNAGGSNRSTHSFFLPIHWAQKALKDIKLSKTPKRGSIGTVFSRVTLEKVRQLKFPKEILSGILKKKPNITGMLQVSMSYPSSPSSKKLYHGDILFKVQKKFIGDNFQRLANILDQNISNELEIEIFRGAIRKKFNVKVLDLQKLIPKSYFWAGNAMFHDLTYHLLLRYFIPHKGVYVAHAWHMLKKDGIPSGIIITAADGNPISNLEEWIKHLSAKKHGERVRIEYIEVNNRNKKTISSFSVERKWFPFSRWDYDPNRKLWKESSLK